MLQLKNKKKQKHIASLKRGAGESPYKTPSKKARVEQARRDLVATPTNELPLGLIGLEASPSVMPRILDTYSRIEGCYQECVYSTGLGNAKIIETSASGTPLKIQSKTPRKRIAEKISTEVCLERSAKKSRVIYFATKSDSSSGYDSDSESKKIYAQPGVTTDLLVRTAIVTLDTIRARKLQSRNPPQEEVMGGSADEIFKTEMAALDFISSELKDAPKVHAHKVAKALGGDGDVFQEEVNLKITTSRCNINMYIPERLITKLLKGGQFDEMRLEVNSEELLIDGKSTKIALGINYKINQMVEIKFNGLSIQRLPTELRRLIRATIEVGLGSDSPQRLDSVL